ncbi:sulfatase-like hydrolase/transferase [Luteolibacter yonseiensis]|uniref:Sulfatase-like hydrolase/transferase n=1 Tax=Luteolibacter yonseiensis TaxID=1144680 RepID=A0A934VC70_9BACT|nr:sulfatase-like hydrolase/transferase [Luteolibacter yonseiensis]MBK1818018.1 sulfatase-like hydrolase/transferase [Luteolibacter yonseiensis]
MPAPHSFLSRLTFVSLALSAIAPAADKLPNIVLIYADDIGYGDIGSYGAKRISTPNIDKIAAAGIRHTNGHSAAATCTPSRYSLMTGRYAWRQQGTNILPGDANLIIRPGSLTLPSLLAKAGYETGVVGKWHLGLGDSKIDWNKEIKPGPLEIGFGSAFIIPATGDRVPTVFVEDHRVRNLDPADPLEVSYQENFPGEPTGKDNPELLRVRHSHGHNQSIHGGIGRIGYQRGGRAARWTDENIADDITAKAVSFIEGRKDKPFFLFFATHDAHVPRTPNPRFVGKTPLGPRGDAIAEFDWSVGEIANTLDRLGLADNTLVIISSDNGPVLDDGYQDGAPEKNGDHRPGGPWRGGKTSAFEAATRVPFIVRWPARVKPGVSGALVSQIDLTASLASLTGQALAADDAPDSFNQLATLLGESKKDRDYLVSQGSAASITRDGWKYIEPVKGQKPTKIAASTNTETGRDNVPQLYHLTEDPGETTNAAAEHPGRVAELVKLLEEVRSRKSTRPE